MKIVEHSFQSISLCATQPVLQLAAHAKIFVNDAFGAAHRAHASTVGVTKYMDHSVAGFLMEKELDYLKGAMDSPNRPFLAMIGGAKVSTKVRSLALLFNLLRHMRSTVTGSMSCVVVDGLWCDDV